MLTSALSTALHQATPQEAIAGLREKLAQADAAGRVELFLQSTDEALNVLTAGDAEEYSLVAATLPQLLRLPTASELLQMRAYAQKWPEKIIDEYQEDATKAVGLFTSAVDDETSRRGGSGGGRRIGLWIGLGLAAIAVGGGAWWFLKRR